MARLHPILLRRVPLSPLVLPPLVHPLDLATRVAEAVLVVGASAVFVWFVADLLRGVRARRGRRP